MIFHRHSTLARCQCIVIVLKWIIAQNSDSASLWKQDKAHRNRILSKSFSYNPNPACPFINFNFNFGRIFISCGGAYTRTRTHTRVLRNPSNILNIINSVPLLFLLTINHLSIPSFIHSISHSIYRIYLLSLASDSNLWRKHQWWSFP